MKKFKFGNRVLALALALIMVISLCPLSALAGTVGYITTGNYAGDTGIDESTLNTNGTINWPIKIYDYLSDGMLFEFAQYGDDTLYADPNASYSAGGGQYVLGEPMPYAVYGSNYTAESGFTNSSYAYQYTSLQRGVRYTPTKVAAVDYTSPQYLRLKINTSSSSSGNRNFYVADFANDNSDSSIYYSEVRYMVMVYRSSGIPTSTTNDYFGTSMAPMSILIYKNGSSWTRYNYTTWTNSSEWTYVVIDLYSLGWTSGYTPNLSITPNFDNSTDYLDLSQVAFFSTKAEATEYGDNCLLFNSDPGEFISGGWNAANNTAYGMLFPTNGDMWPTGGGMGESSYTNYWTQQIGYRQPDYDSSASTYNNKRYNGTDSYGRLDGSGSLIGDSNQIYYLSSSYATSDTYMEEHPDDYAEGFDTSELQYDGYTLLNKVTQGLMTTGLLEGTLSEDGTPQYRQETVEYIADLLSKTLVIPQKATNGNNNYNYVAGVKNAEQYGTTNGEANDLAQGLRNCLGIVFTSGESRGSTPKMGDYATTAAKGTKLKGAFLTVASNGYITTCMDAAYYLLNNLFVADSYNQTQDDFRYLTLSSVTMDNGKEAYVFDGGFSYGADPEDLEDGTLSQDEYKAQSQNAVDYSQSYHLSGDGTLSLGPVQAKDYFWYATYGYTTRFPFLPVVDSEGVYAGESNSYYFAEDGKRSFESDYNTYNNRNYCYVLASNGEFVYAEEDGLFFEFEGDDDVYLFINGQLVLDLGAAHSVSNMSFEVNDYVYWAREVLDNPDDYTEDEIARAQALDLEEGEVATFDFYYMERHGYGANMRIVTNMRITDPALGVEKTAYQGKEIDYGGIVDADDPIEYNFKLTNVGNTKLYNLTFEDGDIGVSLTPDNGLLVKGDDTDTVDDDINGYLVTDARGERLDAQDITAVVTGYKQVDSGGDYIQSGHTYTKVEAGAGTHIYYEGINVTFTDNEALKNFLKTLQSSETDDETVSEELTQSGMGLWVDASVTFKGIYYTMTDEQEEAGSFNNTVYVTATTKADTTETGNETLRSQDNHRVYVTAIPSYYQWAEKDLFVSEELILTDATSEAGNENSMLHDYQEFFNTVGGDVSLIYTQFCDKYGSVLDDDTAYKYVKTYTDADGTEGYKANYDTSGIYEFYLLMYVKGATGDVETMNLGEYAVVRVLIIVTDVEDSEYVLDYGLTTDNLDKEGELFKNDELYGSLSGTAAKLMGVTNLEPSYLNVVDGVSQYNRIDFSAISLDNGNQILTEDGYYTVNLSIPEEGKTIKYNEYSGRYSLTDEGTILVHADVPVSWENLYLYYWYDDGRNNSWPGEAMTMTSHGNFELAIPDNAPHIIISNGTNQTVDLNINTGMEVWVDIDGTLNSEGLMLAGIEYKSADGIVHASVPEDWGDVYLYMWDDFGNPISEWPGTQIETVDENGYYTCTIPGDITNVIINNGANGKQTFDLVVYAGQETWITVNDESSSYNEEMDNYYYNATSSRSTETVTFHATVPDDWAGASVYYWNSNGSSTGVTWPGVAMTQCEDGTYILEGVPADVTNVIINSGEEENAKQTYDTVITPGLETWFEVEPLVSTTTVQTTVPSSWSSVYFYFYNDSVAGDEGDAWPGTQVLDSDGDGVYEMEVPAYANCVVINNGSGIQTANLALTSGKINSFVVESTGLAISTESTTLKIVNYDNWDNVYLHYWKDGGTSTTWPGEQLTKGDDGYYTYEIPAGYSHFIVNDNSGTQTSDVAIPYLGGEMIVTVYADGGYTCNSTTTLDTKNSVNVTYGEAGEEEGFTFTPTDFMDSVYDMYIAITVHEIDINTSQKPTALGQEINIGKEVQMYKKVSVLPATVVYYEDDFAGITYNYDGANVITHYGEGSGSLSQSVDQTQQYGQDVAYQGSNNDEITGGSLTDVYINDTKAFASFEFTGTGFEIIGHTHAVGSGTLMVTIKKDGSVIKRVPVITEYDNGADGGTESIVAVPVVKVSDLEYGTYTVELSGIPVYNFEDWDGTSAPSVETSYLCIDGVRVFQPLKGYEGTLDESDERVLYTATAPYYYQWGTSAGTFINETILVADATAEANDDSSALAEYKEFFDYVNGDTSKYSFFLCDENGENLGDQEYVTSLVDGNGDGGVLTAYTEPGTYQFYVVMFSIDKYTELKESGSDAYESISSYSDGEYAFFPVTVIVVQDDSVSAESTNIALNATYTAEETTLNANWVGNGCLTDGVAPAKIVYSSGNWHGFSSTDNTDANSQGIITVDLGKTYSLDKFNLYLLYYGSYGIGNPNYIEVYTSDDNASYEFVGNLNFTVLSSNNTTQWATLTKDAEGRYVKFVVGPSTDNTWVFVGEVQVYGTEITEATYNIAHGKEVTAEGYGNWGACDLTDGVAETGISWSKNSDGNYTDWFGFHNNYNASVGYGEVVVDLKNVCDINVFKMHLSQLYTDLAVGAPAKVTVEVSSDGGTYKEVGMLTVNGSATADYWASLAADTQGRYVRFRIYNTTSSWVFLNEIEVYGEPVETAGVHDAYLETESGATFTEIRNLIADRKVFAIKYDDTDGLSVSGGTSTWIENRNNVLPSERYTKWSSNIVNSVNDYLLAGPNNEVYMMEATETNKTALAFYISEGDGNVHNIQIALRALDYGSYIGSQTTGYLNAEIQYGAYENGEYVWKTLTTANSSAEQYFTIPYTECPYDADNDRYQIVLRVADTDPTGMVSYINLKYKGIELLELNSSEIPDVIYDDELANTIVDSYGNTLETSEFVNFLELAGQMASDTEVEDDTNVDSTTTTVEGTDTSSMALLYDSFTADSSSNFALTENSRFYIVTTSESVAPATDVVETVQLAQKQFAADGYEMDIVWGLAQFAEAGDILVYVNSDYFEGVDNYDEAYKLTVTDRAAVYTRYEEGLLYGLNTLQKHFRQAGTNAIKGFTLVDAPDTAERTVHLDVARKYLTKEYVCNFVREMSWMGYNSLELHFSEDGGFRIDFWDDVYYPQVTGATGNDFSWVCGSEPAYWVSDAGSDENLGDTGKYLTTEELIEILEVCKEYNIDVIPSFDTPAHVDWLTKNYYNTSQTDTSIKTFTYNGTSYTLPTYLNYRTTSTSNSRWAVLNLGDDSIQNFAFAMYTDIAAFFSYYAGSTKFNIGGDEVGLTSTDTWDYDDFIAYINDLNDILNDNGYTVRMYNDFVGNTNYATSTAESLASNIEIVMWSDDNSNYKTASEWVSEGRVMHSGINYWTYYVLRLNDSTSGKNSDYANMDARDPNCKWWSFYRNGEEYSYAEWNPSLLSGYGKTEYTVTGDQLASGYFMLWHDYAGINTEVEIWNGCWDESGSENDGKYFYSLIDRMWSNTIKQWNWDVNSTLSFEDYETLRDEFGHFPGYDATIKNSAGEEIGCSTAVDMGESVALDSTAYRTPYTVTFKNYNGSVIDTQIVTYGNSATAPADPTRPTDVWYTYTFTGWDTAFDNITSDTVVTAQYSASAAVAGTVGYVEVTVSGGTNFNLSVDGETARAMGTDYLNASMALGKKLTVTAETTNSNKFIGWVNAKTGDILSTERTYTFYTSGNDVLIALFDTDIDGKGTVTFKNDKNNQIFDIQYYTSTDSIVFPEDPTFPGYVFAGWDHTEDEILEKLEAGKDVTVRATWNVEDVYFSITVNGGVVTTNGGMVDDKYTGYKGTVISANKAPSGKMFSHWEDSDGNIVSYDTEYKFYPYRDETFTAVYVSEYTYDIDIVDTYIDETESEDTTTEEEKTTYRVYFTNNWSWSDINIYYWNDDNSSDSTTNSGWPGMPMNFDDYYEIDGVEYEVWYYDVPIGITGMIINGLKSDDPTVRDQTPDITEIVDGRGYSMTWNDGNQVVIDDSKVTVVSDTKIIYVTTPDTDGVYAAYVWNSNLETGWLDMTLVTGNTYSVEVPNKYTNIIIAKLNEGTTADWDNVQTQSVDLTISSDNNHFVISDNLSGGTFYTGIWSKMVNVYFNNENSWSNIRVDYTATVNGKVVSGTVYVDMTSGTDNLYAVVVPVELTSITFTDSATEEGTGYTYTVQSDDVVTNAIFGMAEVERTVDYSVITNAFMDTTTLGDSNTVFFSWSVPEELGYTFVNAGVLLVKATDYNASTFVVGTIDEKVIQFVPAKRYLTDTGAHSLTIPNVASGDTWIYVSFVQYKDENGALRTKYSEQYTATK